MRGKPSYKSEPRYDYGAVDYYEGKHCIRNVLTNIKPLYLADNIEGQLNDAVSKGSEYIKEKARLCFVRNHTLNSIIDCLIEEKVVTEGGIKYE